MWKADYYLDLDMGSSDDFGSTHIMQYRVVVDAATF